MNRSKIYLWVYVVLSLLHLVGAGTAHEGIIFATKPLLMPVLALWFWTSTPHQASSIRWGMLLALLFALGGDTFLMLEEHNSPAISLFLPGLVSFLLTHLLYIFVFGKIAKGSRAYLFSRPLVVAVLIIFLFGINFYLWPDLPSGLNVAVAVYSTCIVAMAAAAINTRIQIPDQAYFLLLAGAFCFIFSDTVIALNKFKSTQLSIPYVRLIIMFFYLLGQVLIVGGVVKSRSD